MAATNAGVPIAAFGRDPSIAKAVAEVMAPDYDVVHTVTGNDVSVAVKELKALVSGDLSTVPSNGVGSNLNRPEAERRMPVCIGAGGGIPEEEYELLKKEIGDDKVKWIKVRIEDIRRIGNVGGPNPEVLNRIWREKLKELGL